MTGDNHSKKNQPMDTREIKAASHRPLFFENPQLVTSETHQHKAVPKDLNMVFARYSNIVPLTLTDIPHAAKNYPILFTAQENIMPVALVGLEQENYFVDDAGMWMERSYIPNYVRKYPFILMQEQGQEKMMLGVDDAALVPDTGENVNVLYEQGQPSSFSRNMLELCTVYQEQYHYTRQFSDELNALKMLSVQGFDIELANGRKIQLGGFQLIDIEAYKSLSEQQAFDWYKRGLLEFVYYIIQSYSCWGDIMTLANKREKIIVH